MTSIAADGLFVAGFALAHATWSVSDTTVDELLCPLAVVQDGDGRRLLRFEAESQELAIESGKDAMRDLRRADTTYAFAREGQWRPDGPGTAAEDLLTVEFWAPPMTEPQALLLPFRRADRDATFSVGTGPLLVLDGVIVPLEDAQPAIDVVLEGVQSHPAAAELWQAWKGASSGDL